MYIVRVKVEPNAFLTSAQDGGEWSDSRLSGSTPGESKENILWLRNAIRTVSVFIRFCLQEKNIRANEILSLKSAWKSQVIAKSTKWHTKINLGSAPGTCIWGGWSFTSMSPYVLIGWRKGKVAPVFTKHHAMKTYWRVEV
jgi:hypothetical protein